ncbi:MAG TPA: hypothetical protein PLV32_10450, partial [Chitinophagaceae bacterium]|nr:hypothetical protein [Chitinophagaceae bacterium]
SLNNDTRFSINQAFSLPVVYKRQRQLYEAQEEVQQKWVNWQEAEIVREVKMLFYQLAEMRERGKMLNRLDSVFNQFQQSAALRLEAGETN